MNKKKKLWIPITAVVLVAAAVAAWFLIPRTPQDEVYVYGFDMVGYVNYYQNGTESYGMVTTDRVQAEYISDTKTVTQIMVYQGQEVKRGDILYSYDTTLSDLTLERKDLAIQQMEVNLKKAKAELQQLNAMVPMVIPETVVTPTEPEVTDDNCAPVDEAMLNQVLGGSGQSASNPKRVWLGQDHTITEEEIERYLDGGTTVYVLFQMTEDDAPGVEFSKELGVCYTRLESTDNATAVATPEDPSTESTEETEPEETFDNIIVVPSPEVSYTMAFFEPVEEIVETDPSTEIQWNSGYTQTELVSMRKAKAQEIEDLEFDIKIAKAELEIMRKEAADGNVYAEFDGVVVSVLEPANAIALNAPMIKVNGGGGFYVEGSVSELDLATIQVGQTVTVTSWDTYAEYEGTVVSVGSYPVEDQYYYSSTNVSYYPYKVFIDQSADLQDGYYVSMVYQAEPQEGGTMYLENAFILTEGGESYIYVRGDSGRLEKRVVTTGDNTGYTTEILSGLSETDYIAFPYGKTVKAGAPTVEGTWEDLHGY